MSQPQPGQCYMIPIGSIYWTQASISSTFRDPPYERLRTWHLRLRRMPLQERLAFINDLDIGFPPIRIVGFSSNSFWPDSRRWFSLDNRRLWVYRSVLPPQTQIVVRIATPQEAAELINKLTTPNNGETVIVRGDERRRPVRTIDPASLDDGENIDDDNSNFFGEEGDLLREIGEIDNSGIADPFADMSISNEESGEEGFGGKGGEDNVSGAEVVQGDGDGTAKTGENVEDK